MPSFDSAAVERRAHVREQAAAGQAAPAPEPAPDLGEFAVRTFQLVYVESAPGTWRVGGVPVTPDGDPEDYFEFDPFLDKHLPEPFRAALIELAGGAMDGTRCWTCAKEVVGWAETYHEDTYGRDVYGMTWAAVGLLHDPGSGDPVNLLCETCTPFTLDKPSPQPPQRYLPALEVKADA